MLVQRADIFFLRSDTAWLLEPGDMLRPPENLSMEAVMILPGMKKETEQKIRELDVKCEWAGPNSQKKYCGLITFEQRTLFSTDLEYDTPYDARLAVVEIVKYVKD